MTDIYWRYAFRELRQKIRLKLGEQDAILTTQANALVKVANGILGDGKTTSGPPVKKVGEGYASAEAAAEAINAMLTI